MGVITALHNLGQLHALGKGRQLVIYAVEQAGRQLSRRYKTLYL